MNKIKTASINTKNGSVIKFETPENTTLNNLFKVSYNSKNHYFQSTNIEIGQDNQLIVEAKEVGYWARKFDRLPDLDIRTIIGLSVIKITDPLEIKSINETSCWC